MQKSMSLTCEPASKQVLSIEEFEAIWHSIRDALTTVKVPSPTLPLTLHDLGYHLFSSQKQPHLRAATAKNTVKVPSHTLPLANKLRVQARAHPAGLLRLLSLSHTLPHSLTLSLTLSHSLTGGARLGCLPGGG